MTPCVVWTGGRFASGYGRQWREGKWRRAHVLAYEAACGAVPKGMELDHLCRNRACVNPEHLEPVTHAENVRRGDRFAMGSRNREKTACRNGHSFDAENTHLRPDGTRYCRACARERERQRRNRLKHSKGGDPAEWPEDLRIREFPR